jgi:hypothetical protein
MELHDDVDHIVTYDQDATMIFQPVHPQYKLIIIQDGTYLPLP